MRRRKRKNPAPMLTVAAFDPDTKFGVQRVVPALTADEAVHKLLDKYRPRPGWHIEVRRSDGRLIGQWFVQRRETQANPGGKYRVTIEWKSSGAFNTASHYDRPTLKDAKKFMRMMVRDYGPQIAKASVSPAR